MKNLKKYHWIPLLVLFLSVWAIRFQPLWGEYYARHLYPPIAGGLSAIAGMVPFSVGDCFVVFSCLWLAVMLVRLVVCRQSRRQRAKHILTYLVWVYVWFYWAWGLNYFRENFYVRTRIPTVSYNQDDFHAFLSTYIEDLNNYYVAVQTVDTLLLQQELQKGYAALADRFGLLSPHKIMKAKPMLSSWLMSQMGVLGYMQPFFDEFCLNKELLPVQYPASYAHEMAHRLGVASEAEANLYAYLVCSRSHVPAIRFSGYFSLFPYIMGNAASVLPQEEYRQLLSAVPQEVIDLYKKKSDYWESRYSPLIGEIQHAIYNLYLKGNKIQSGTANYSQVVGLLMAYQASEK